MDIADIIGRLERLVCIPHIHTHQDWYLYLWFKNIIKPQNLSQTYSSLGSFEDLVNMLTM